MTGQRMTWTAGAALCVVALSGCAGSSSAGSTSAPAPGSSDSALASSPSSGSGSQAPYTDAQACAWLKRNLPRLPDTAVGAQAQLTIGLSSFFADHGGLPGADGYALDAALARGCPALHDAALKKAGLKSFGNL